MNYLPNYFPLQPTENRLAIVGSNPTPQDLAFGRHFSSGSFNLLSTALQNSGIQPSTCFKGFVYNQAPPGGVIDNVDKSSADYQQSLIQLINDLNKFQPNCVLLLGPTPLIAAGSFHKISNYRGTIFSGFSGRHKCVATYSPDYLQKVWDETPLFSFDVNRAVKQALFPELRLPQRTLEPTLTAPEVLSRLASIKPNSKLSIDIEGGYPNPDETTYKHLDGITCIGISTDPSHAWTINLQDFDDPTKLIVMQALNRVLSEPTIEKILQNGLYDYVVLSKLWKLHIVNIAHDTMFSGWEIYPELPKSLGVQASIWSEEPYYKFERTSGADLEASERKKLHYTYCCKDAAVTLEIHNNHMAAMTPSQRDHYNFNMSLLPSLQYMSMRGIRYDRELAAFKQSELTVKMRELQLTCNHLANQEININSPIQMCNLLYKKLGFEPQYMKEAGRKTTKLTANAEAMLKIIVKQGTNAHPFLKNALAWKKLEGVRKQLDIKTDPDGRMRCSYKLVGTETGRLSCQGSVTGSGTNLQTITEQLRDCYVPDPGYAFFQCDLSGADGWTVAARAAMLGDPTMLEDYQAGMKPAKIIALMYMQMQGQLPHVTTNINDLPREEVKRLTKITEIPKSLYAVCKAVQHGSSYDMGPNTMASNILTKTFKESSDLNVLWVPPNDCKRIQLVFFRRYPGVIEYQRWVQQQLNKHGRLSCASGHVRMFFGRPGNDVTYRAAYSHEPQANTTYATNLAMQRLWQDSENRNNSGNLIIQPLHSVHDALCGQFPIERTEWAVGKIQSYFNNALSIGNERLVIPYEGGYGQSWLHTKEGYREGEI